MLKSNFARGTLASLFCAAAVVLLWKTKQWQDPPPLVRAPAVVDRAQAERAQAESKARADADRATKDDQLAAGVEARLERLLDPSHRSRWNVLEGVRDVHVRADGTALFAAAGTGAFDPDYRHALERMAARRSRVYGGELRLMDSRGRLWGTGGASRNVLMGFDGHAWIEHPQPFQDDYQAAAYEDRSGNLWFTSFSFQTGFESHEFTAAGRWIDTRVFAVKDTPGASIDTRFVISEAPPGVMTLSHFREPEEGNGPVVIIGDVVLTAPPALLGPDCPGVFRLADGAWSHVTPAVCEDHRTTAMLPTPDGDVISLCAAGRMRVHPVMTDAKLQKLLDRLQDDDVAVRDAATNELRQLDPQWLARARRAAAAGQSPEVQARLGKVGAEADSGTTASEGGEEAEAALVYYDRYTTGRAKIIARPLGRPPVLCVDDFSDQRTSRRYAHALVRLTPGEWSITKLPEDWSDDLVAADEDAFEDPEGRLWLKCGVRIDRDGGLSRPFPADFRSERVLGRDGLGRLYLRTSHGEIVMFDESVPVGGTDAVAQDVEFSGDLAQAEDGSLWTWPAAAPGTLCRFSGGEWKSVPGAPRGAGTKLEPLARGGMLAMLARADDRVAVFDGTTWTSAPTLGEMVRKHADLLRRVLPRRFDRPFRFAVAQDADGNVWTSAHSRVENERRGWVEYYSRGVRHDLATEMQAEGDNVCGAPDPVLLGNGGGLWFKGVLGAAVGHVHDGTFTWKYVDKARPGAVVMLNGINAYELPALYDADGSFLLHGGYTVNAVGEVADDAVEFTGVPRFFDGEHRLWSLASGRIFVQARNTSAHITLPANEYESRLLRGSDGRVWLVDAHGFYQLRAVGPDDNLRVEQVGHWTWDVPWTSDLDAMLDDCGGLWIYSPTGHARRIALPGSDAHLSGAFPPSIGPAAPGAAEDVIASSANPELADALTAHLHGHDDASGLTRRIADMPLVPTGTIQGASQWRRVTLNREGKGVGAVRFRIPPGQPRYVQWGMACGPHAVSGFTIFNPADVSADVVPRTASYNPRRFAGFDDAAPGSELLLASLDEALLPADSDVVLIFTFADKGPVTLDIAVNAIADARALDLGPSLGLSEKESEK